MAANWAKQKINLVFFLVFLQTLTLSSRVVVSAHLVAHAVQFKLGFSLFPCLGQPFFPVDVRKLSYTD